MPEVDASKGRVRTMGDSEKERVVVAGDETAVQNGESLPIYKNPPAKGMYPFAMAVWAIVNASTLRSAASAPDFMRRRRSVPGSRQELRGISASASVFIGL